MATTTRRIDQIAAMATERLEAELVTLSHRITHDTGHLLLLIGEFDHRGTWAHFGALSCATWLAEVCDLDIATARTHIRVARAMRRHRTLADAITDGRISYSKARVLVPHLTADNVDELVDLAECHPASRLGIALAHWSSQHEADQDRDQRHQRERRLSWRTDPDGMITLTARLPPADAAHLIALIDQIVITTPKHPGHPAHEPSESKTGDAPDPGSDTISRSPNAPDERVDTPPPRDSGRTIADRNEERSAAEMGLDDREDDASADAPLGLSLAQQRADALLHLAGVGSGGRPASPVSPAAGTVVTELVIHVRGDRNTLGDGTPITDHAVTRLLPAAFISLLIFGAKNHPIDASPRRRSPTRRQRRVLDERHPTCSHPGCNARALLQYDHIQPYARGGTTTLDNLQRLCGPHNRARQP